MLSRINKEYQRGVGDKEQIMTKKSNEATINNKEERREEG